jgi:hypothetical protein
MPSLVRISPRTDGKDTNFMRNKKISLGIICKYWDKFVSLQRQDGYFGYPGKFPERASRIRHYPISKQAASLRESA